MKLPSLFRSVTPMRFDVKPRYYDPIKEELAERTSRIKKELEEGGSLDGESEEYSSKLYGGGIRGAFAQHRGIKPKKQTVLDSSTVIRTVLFFAMIIGAFGYIYIGPQIFTYMLYGAVGLGAGYYLVRFLKRGRKR